MWFETEDKAFRFHLGGRTQIDYVGVHAPQKVRADQATGINSGGTGAGGIGKYDDAVNFRRARLAAEGTFYEVFDFLCEYDFINTTRNVPGGTTPALAGPLFASNADRANVFNTPVPTDLWLQWTHIPLIGTVRVGNQKPWNSFEHMTSSRFLDFMERSLAFDAFFENGNNGFQPGISVFNQFLDQRLSFAAGVYAPNKRDIFGWNVGDGEMQVTTRIWGTPIYENAGRFMLHMGVSYTHSTADDGTIRYRARSQIRNGPAALHNIIAIIQANASDENILAPEIAFNYGPFSMSAEYYGTWAYGKPGQAITNAAGQNVSAATPRGGYGQLFYQGGYVSAGYFLTGEHRAYNRGNGGWDRQPVNEYAFMVDGEEGTLLGRGAWQVVGRYSYLDLEDKNINGGIINEGTLGLNWFLNANSKIQVNYDLAYRDATRYNANGTVPRGGLTARDGLIQGFGTRLAFDF